jgi:hypothetical protein
MASIETAQTATGDLNIVFSILDCPKGQYSAGINATFADRDPQSGGAYWRRPGTVSAAATALTLTPAGANLQVPQ